MTKLAASIALHGLSLAVAGKVVRTAALVASRCPVASKATAEPAAVATSSWRTAGTTTNWRSVGGWAVALGEVNTRASIVHSRHIPQDGLPDRTSSSVHPEHHRSNGALGSQPGRGRVLDSGSTAWLDPLSVSVLFQRVL